tara:strand:- start:110 stop:370 length:261 start_codon:yes stop_codon:yes gene_type:complete
VELGGFEYERVHDQQARMEVTALASSEAIRFASPGLLRPVCFLTTGEHMCSPQTEVALGLDIADIKDIEEDKENGFITLPVKFGKF